MHSLTQPAPRRLSLPSLPSVGHFLTALLRFLLVALVVLLLILPVVPLPIVTMVPTPVWALLLAADLALVVGLIRFRHAPRAFIAVLLGFVVVAALAVAASQAFAATPPILGADGQPLPGSIASLEKVVLNGTEQWITIRGKDTTKPVLLYLGIGGPGAGGFPATAMTLKPLEDHFVVVNWDQPGTGKSYSARPIATLTVQQFVDDARALTEMLRQRFHQPKVYVMGLSWGTILGINLVQQYPDLFYAFIGTGQMVNTTENDRFGYDLALQVVEAKGDSRTLNTLRSYGPPPYRGDGMALKYAAYNNVLFDYMGNARLEMVLLVGPQFAREYGWVDKVNFDRGLLDGYPVVYSQLYDLDFTTQAARLDVPVYFLHGRNDVNAVASLVERYYTTLQAPYKELVWLKSGHGAGAEDLVDGMLNHVLVTTPPSQNQAR